MKPSRNALIGYTYQEQITFMLLVLMDLDRSIEMIEIEVDEKNNFDDVKLTIDGEFVNCQIKDIDDIRLSDISILEDKVTIKGKEQELAKDCQNILIFKSIDLERNCEFLGIPAFYKNDVKIVSLSRVEVDEIIDSQYGPNEKRRVSVRSFFNKQMDSREWLLKRENLPPIDTFDTTLLEKTIDLGRRHLEFSNILFFEGKPGVGKSHYVATLSRIYKPNIVYRFWISNQDRDYTSRLNYSSFIADISKQIFKDYKIRTEQDILYELAGRNDYSVIIDGLDHVENYNKKDLKLFIDFIDKLKEHVNTIVLSRPLKYEISWNKQVLGNWNKEETYRVLRELYLIEDYKVLDAIFNLTNGYPILVRFVGEHYKLSRTIPTLEKLDGLDDYYSQILDKIGIKSALTIFLTCRGFYMTSELEMFLEKDLLNCVLEAVKSYPYLFEVRLNRISLFHDSLNKYLRNSGIDYQPLREKVNNFVSSSILKCETRFMSRISHFDLENESKKKIVKRFSSISIYKNLSEKCIDFEALRDFYEQIRVMVSEQTPDILEIKDYYDLSLILNVIVRDHVSSIDTFLYTYVRCLIFNGYTIENVTSSGYLFSMFAFVLGGDSTLLYKFTKDSDYSVKHFSQKLEEAIDSEEKFFIKHERPIQLNEPVEKYIRDDYHWREYLNDILTNIYIHKTSNEELSLLQECVDTFIDEDEEKGIQILEGLFNSYDLERLYPSWVLNSVKETLLSLGKLPERNVYLKLDLKELIVTNSNKGSFDLWPKILSYMRLSRERKHQFDISNIGIFWNMYGFRKDYTVINIHEALTAFEGKGLITEKESIEQIACTQDMSKKGIRHILSE